MGFNKGEAAFIAKSGHQTPTRKRKERLGRAGRHSTRPERAVDFLGTSSWNAIDHTACCVDAVAAFAAILTALHEVIVADLRSRQS